MHKHGVCNHIKRGAGIVFLLFEGMRNLNDANAGIQFSWAICRRASSDGINQVNFLLSNIKIKLSTSRDGVTPDLSVVVAKHG